MALIEGRWVPNWQRARWEHHPATYTHTPRRYRLRTRILRIGDA